MATYLFQCVHSDMSGSPPPEISLCTNASRNIAVYTLKQISRHFSFFLLLGAGFGLLTMIITKNDVVKAI